MLCFVIDTLQITRPLESGSSFEPLDFTKGRRFLFSLVNQCPFHPCALAVILQPTKSTVLDNLTYCKSWPKKPRPPESCSQTKKGLSQSLTQGLFSLTAIMSMGPVHDFELSLLKSFGTNTVIVFPLWLLFSFGGHRTGCGRY